MNSTTLLRLVLGLTGGTAGLVAHRAMLYLQGYLLSLGEGGSGRSFLSMGADVLKSFWRVDYGWFTGTVWEFGPLVAFGFLAPLVLTRSRVLKGIAITSFLWAEAAILMFCFRITSGHWDMFLRQTLWREGIVLIIIGLVWVQNQILKLAESRSANSTQRRAAV